MRGSESVEVGWQHDFESALQKAAEQGRHVLLDFSAAPM